MDVFLICVLAILTGILFLASLFLYLIESRVSAVSTSVVGFIVLTLGALFFSFPRELPAFYSMILLMLFGLFEIDEYEGRGIILIFSGMFSTVVCAAVFL